MSKVRYLSRCNLTWTLIRHWLNPNLFASACAAHILKQNAAWDSSCAHVLLECANMQQQIELSKVHASSRMLKSSHDCGMSFMVIGNLCDLEWMLKSSQDRGMSFMVIGNLCDLEWGPLQQEPAIGTTQLLPLFMGWQNTLTWIWFCVAMSLT